MMLAVLFFPASGWAHGLNGAYFTATIEPDEVRVKVAWTLQDVLVHFQVQQDNNPAVSPEELDRGIAAATQFFLANVVVATQRGRLVLNRQSGVLERDAAGQEFVVIEMAAHTPSPTVDLTLSLELGFFEAFDQTFSGLLRVVAQDQTQQAVLSIGQPSATFTVGAPRSLKVQILDFVRLGIKHIFLGYDHLMFLAALVLIGGRIGPLVKIVTAFTVAHSLTLVIAALGWVNLPSRLVESCIALSIAYVAAENMLVREPTRRWRLTFIFGLVHGFGFATVLRELGLPTRGLVASLLAFNVGVEVGQVVIVLACLPLVGLIARSKAHRGIVIATSCVILAFGLGWLIERAFGLNFMPI